jgi:pyruvate dehydrogenase E2 component (dihydrolipoamide acetyltransferase)
MPSLGADMEDGTLIAWHVKPGDRVKRGDIIAEVETDKGLFDVESFHEGIIDRLVAEPGAKIPVGALMAVIRGESEPPGPAPVPAVTVAVPAPPVPAVPAPSSVPAPRHVRASPLARKIAAELGVDLDHVEGTGPGGVIERADVERAAAAAKEPVAARPSGMRRAIAAAMSRANREIPHYYLATHIDMGRALQWLEEENRRRPISERLLPAVLLLKATALALREVPELNGFWTGDRFQPQAAVHAGVAIALRGGGLMAPAIHDTDRKSLTELMAALRDLIERTRGGHLRSSEMTDATVTVTNLGDLGVETVFGVIYPPQVALVGFGRIVEQPHVDEGRIAIRPLVQATLAGDHRATDGRTGARFLEALTNHLQPPATL